MVKFLSGSSELSELSLLTQQVPAHIEAEAIDSLMGFMCLFLCFFLFLHFFHFRVRKMHFLLKPSFSSEMYHYDLFIHL